MRSTEHEVGCDVGAALPVSGRPDVLAGATTRIVTGHGPMYVTMNDEEAGPRECFVVLGKPGGAATAFSDALGRMISLALAHGADPAEIVHSKLATEGGGIRTVLYADGTFQVYIGDPVEPSLLIVSGKVNPEERSATGTDDRNQRIGLHETGGRW